MKCLIKGHRDTINGIVLPPTLPNCPIVIAVILPKYVKGHITGQTLLLCEGTL
jgi:hypothetical protein